MVYVMCKMCRAGHQLENRVVIAREALRILALGVLSVMDDIEPKRRRREDLAFELGVPVRRAELMLGSLLLVSTAANFLTDLYAASPILDEHHVDLKAGCEQEKGLRRWLCEATSVSLSRAETPSAR